MTKEYILQNSSTAYTSLPCTLYPFHFILFPFIPFHIPRPIHPNKPTRSPHLTQPNLNKHHKYGCNLQTMFHEDQDQDQDSNSKSPVGFEVGLRSALTIARRFVCLCVLHLISRNDVMKYLQNLHP